MSAFGHCDNRRQKKKKKGLHLKSVIDIQWGASHCISTSPKMLNHYRVIHFQFFFTDSHSNNREAFIWETINRYTPRPYKLDQKGMGGVASMSDPLCKRCWFCLKAGTAFRNTFALLHWKAGESYKDNPVAHISSWVSVSDMTEILHVSLWQIKVILYRATDLWQLPLTWL